MSDNAPSSAYINCEVSTASTSESRSAAPSTREITSASTSERSSAPSCTRESSTARTTEGNLGNTTLTSDQFEQLICLLTKIHCQQLPNDLDDDQPGGMYVEWFKSLSAAAIGISTLGGAVSYTAVSSFLPDPPEQPDNLSGQFSRGKIRRFLVVGWALFLFALGLASFGAVCLSFHREEIKEIFDGENPLAKIGILTASLVLEGVLLAAIMMLHLSLVKYDPEVAWTCVAFTAAFALMGICLWLRKIAQWRKSSCAKKSKATV